MPITEILSIRSDVLLSIADNGNYTFTSSAFKFTLKQVSPGIASAISALFKGGKTLEQLLNIIENRDGWFAIPQFHFCLDQFLKRGIVCRSIWLNNNLLVTVIPIASQSLEVKYTIHANARYILSRFAFLRNDSEYLVLESPLSWVKIVLQSNVALTIVTSLARPRLFQELLDTNECITVEVLMNLRNRSQDK